MNEICNSYAGSIINYLEYHLDMEQLDYLKDGIVSILINLYVCAVDRGYKEGYQEGVIDYTQDYNKLLEKLQSKYRVQRD